MDHGDESAGDRLEMIGDGFVGDGEQWKDCVFAGAQAIASILKILAKEKTNSNQKPPELVFSPLLQGICPFHQ